MRNHWLALLASLCAASAMGAVYKWVDASGVTHYSETPPPNAETRELPIQASPPAPGGEAAAPSEAPAQPAAAPQGASTREAEAKRASDTRDTYCAIAQRSVQVLKSSNPVVELNGEGQEMILSAEQRAAALADANRRVDKYCKPE
jgi:hypothetical protein